MLKYGINLLFVVFTQIIFYSAIVSLSYGSVSGLVVIIFLIEFTISGYLIYIGYNKEYKKEDQG